MDPELSDDSFELIDNDNETIEIIKFKINEEIIQNETDNIEIVKIPDTVIITIENETETKTETETEVETKAEIEIETETKAEIEIETKPETESDDSDNTDNDKLEKIIDTQPKRTSFNNNINNHIKKLSNQKYNYDMIDNYDDFIEYQNDLNCYLNKKYCKLCSQVVSINKHIEKKEYMNRFNNKLKSLQQDINEFYGDNKQVIFGLSTTFAIFGFINIGHNLKIKDDYNYLKNHINIVKHYVYNFLS